MEIIDSIEHLPCIIGKHLLVFKWTKPINELVDAPLVHVLHVDVDFVCVFFAEHTAVIVFYNVGVSQLAQHTYFTQSVE